MEDLKEIENFPGYCVDGRRFEKLGNEQMNLIETQKQFLKSFWGGF